MLKYLPLPVLRITSGHLIREASEEAERRFGPASRLADLMDMESMDKTARFIQPSKSDAVVELNLLGTDGKLHLYDIHQAWPDTESGWLICVPKQPAIERVNQSVRHLRELLEHKRRDGTLNERVEAPKMLHQEEAAASLKESLRYVETGWELLSILRPALTDIGKEDYADLILEQLAGAVSHIQSVYKEISAKDERGIGGERNRG